LTQRERPSGPAANSVIVTVVGLQSSVVSGVTLPFVRSARLSEARLFLTTED